VRYIIIVSMIVIVSCESLFNSFAFFPDRKYIIPNDQLPLNVSLVPIKTEDGIRIESLLYRSGGKKMVIYFHGNAGNMYRRIYEAEKIAASGADVLIVSYRGYGQSGGSPDEKGIYLDGKAACLFAETELKFKPENIFIYGRSLGTAVAVNVSMKKKYAGVILTTPMTAADELAGTYGLSIFKRAASGHLESLKKINDIESPLLVIHGTNDRTIPYSMGERIYQAYHGKKKMVTIEFADHNNLEIINPEEYWGSIIEFIRNN
jgi:fermentation-respiration switch protein FrsA (DUF1100 family)